VAGTGTKHITRVVILGVLCNQGYEIIMHVWVMELFSKYGKESL